MRLPGLSFESLSAVVAVAKHGGIGPAARELGLTPSAVDKRIRSAGQALGTRLFERVEDGLELTRAGAVFLTPAMKAIQYAMLAEARTRAPAFIDKPRLLLGHSPYLAPRLLGAIRRLSLTGLPGFTIERRSGLMATLIERLLDGKLHAALGFLPVRHPDLIGYEIFEEPLVICLPADHKLARRPMLSPTDIAGEPVIAVAREPFPALHEELEEYFDSFSVHLRVVEDAFMPSEALALVEQKAGICFLAKSSALRQPGVEIKPLAAPALTRKTGLLVRADNREAPVTVLTSVILEQMKTFRPSQRKSAPKRLQFD